MLARKWKVGHSMGYAGTDSADTIDVVDMGCATEAQLETMTEEDMREILIDEQFEQAAEKISVWANPVETS